jgi:hypothetical protein
MRRRRSAVNPRKTDANKMIDEGKNTQAWNATLNIELDGQTTSFPVGVALLQDIANNYPDTEESLGFFDLMSRHPSAGVRQNVAGKEFLSESAVETLSKDPDLSVLRALCSNQKFRRYAQLEDVAPMILKDRDCAERIAWNLETFENCALSELINVYLSSPDPERRLFAVNNSSLPIKVAKQLSTDPDPSVAEEARKRLAQR